MTSAPSRKKILQTSIVTLLNDNDVLCGRGSGPYDHIGNVIFRKIVLSRKAEYLSASSTYRRKAGIAEEIVSVVRNMEPRGRFLKKVDADVLLDSGLDSGADAWCLVADNVALEKAKQALRQNRDRHLVQDERRQKQQEMQCQEQREGTGHQEEYSNWSHSDRSGGAVYMSGSCPQPVCTKYLNHVVKGKKSLLLPNDHYNSLPYGYMTPTELPDTLPCSDIPPRASDMAPAISWQSNRTNQIFPFKHPSITTDGKEIEFRWNRADFNFITSRIEQIQRYHNWQCQEKFSFAIGNQGIIKKRAGEVIGPASHNQLMPDSGRQKSRRHNLSGHTTEFINSVFKKRSLQWEECLRQEQTQRQCKYQASCVTNSKVPICSEGCEPNQYDSDTLSTAMTLAGMSGISKPIYVSPFHVNGQNDVIENIMYSAK